jgi:two-component system, OmpR family, phosphate regulon sensor histidine kinase PhoR
MQDVRAQREAQFVQAVRTALVAVGQRLERMALAEGVKRAGEMELMEAVAAQEQPKELLTTELLPTTPTEEVLISDMVRGILSSDVLGTFGERIDPVMLDTLLKRELGSCGVVAAYAFALYNGQREQVLASSTWEATRSAPFPAEYRTRVLQSDLFGTQYDLRVRIPGQESLVLRSMWPTLALSIFFLLVIAGAFAYSMRTIVRQRRLGRIKNDLVNNLTHELKTPISTIALACEALNDPGLQSSEERTKAYVGVIRDENKRLGVLVEGVLQSAVLDSGTMRLRPVDLDLHAILADVARNTEILAIRQNGRVTTSLDATLSHVKGDRLHLTNVFYNLVDNAVKYTRNEPRVELRTRSGPTSITVEVADNGIGIPRAEQRRIFDRLYRVPTGNVHNVKGFGLGLSYVKAVVERHGGQVNVRSDLGEGSTFSITLPFEQAHGHTPALGGR